MFDPFKDYQTEGYLRNFLKEKDLKLIKKLEQAVFIQNLNKAINYISKVKIIEPKNFFYVHKILFGNLYPWAGQDRLTMENTKLIPFNTYISKGDIYFLPSDRIHNSLSLTLKNASKKKFINSKPGTILGDFSYIHPFLDGNGRTMLVVFNELCRRANFSIDWSKATRKDYLMNLTAEIENPKLNPLNEYLLQFKKETDFKQED